MTKKEAIEIMARRIFMSKYEQAIKVLKILYSDEFQQFTSSEFDDAIYVAIEALEKRIPKKPVKLNCPNCGFDKIDNSWWVFTYCPKCGQRIDWSSEDDE